MSSPSRNSSESDMTIVKNLAEKVAQDVQALSFTQLHHEARLKEKDAQFALIRDELKVVKDEFTKSKKSSHPSNSTGNESYGEQSLRINEYYQPRPRRGRREKKESPREVRIDLPHFHGKENVEAYLDWEMKVEQLFACHHVSEENKVSLATLSFQGNAMHWWTALERDRRLHKDPPIEYWNDLRGALRGRHMPSYYNRELMDKLQRLQQKTMSVEEYRHKMELYMMKASIRESEYITIARFLGGLNLEIRDRVELSPYQDLNDLIQLCIKVEQQILRKTSSHRESSYSNSYPKEEYRRGEEHIKETSLEPSQNLPKYEHISHTQTREIPCFGNDHLASHCSNERSMILRNNANNIGQEKETSESEENEKKKKEMEKSVRGCLKKKKWDLQRMRNILQHPLQA